MSIAIAKLALAIFTRCSFIQPLNFSPELGRVVPGFPPECPIEGQISTAIKSDPSKEA
jgi:hypothetical protein